MALSPAEGSLIFFVLYSVLITVLLVVLLLLYRRKKSRDSQKNSRNPPHQLPYHENKSFQEDNPVIFVSNATQKRPNNQINEQAFHPEISTVEYEVQRQRNISRGEESLASFKSVVDNYNEDFASVRSDSFHTLYDEVTLCSSSPKNGRLQEEQDFFNAISDNSHLKKKKVAPKPPSISKAKVLRISPSDGFIYDDPTSSENHMNQINQPFHPKNSTPLSNSSNELLEYGILQKPSQKRNLKNVPEIITPLNNIEPDLIAESSKNKLNISSASSLSDVSNDKKLNKRLDSDTSERTIIARDTLPRKIKIVHSDSSESDLASIGDPEFVRLNFKSKDMSSPNNIKKYYPDEKGNLENKYESVDGGFSITDEGMVTSTLRDNKDTFNDSIDESIISGTRMDGNQNYNKVEGKLKMCKPVYYYSSTDTEKDMSDLENVTNISDLNKDMSIISETSTYSIHFQNFKEGSVSKKVETDEPIGYIPGYSSDTNNDSSFIEKIYTPSDPKISANPKYEMKTNATLSTTEIKQIIPVTISSSSSSDSSDESQKYPLYTKIIPSSNAHSFESLTNSTHIDTQPLPKNEDTTPQTFTNIEQTKQFINKKMISKDEFSTTEMKQCIPRTLSSSSSSDFSSDSPKIGSKTKSSPPNNVHSFGSLTHPIQIDTKPLPKNNDTAPQSFTNMQAINNNIHEIQLNDYFSTTEIKQCIPRTLSSSSSSDSSSESPKLVSKTKNSPSNNVPSFGSLTHPIQIDTKPLPKNNNTAPQSFTNMQAINNNIHKIQLNDDFSTTEMKQCIPRTLSSSSSSDSSSDSPKLGFKTKSSPPNNVHSFGSLTHPIQIVTKPLPKNNDTAPQSSINMQAINNNIHEIQLNDDFSTTEIKQCIPKTLSSSSSSDSSSDSPKLVSKTKNSPLNNVHSFGSLTHPIQIDTKPLPKKYDTSPQSFTNIQATNNHVTKMKLNDDFSTTEIKQCIPRTLSSSSSSDSSSSSPKLVSKTKPGTESKSLPNPTHVDNLSYPKMYRDVTKMSTKYVPLSQIKMQMETSPLQTLNSTPDHSHFKLIKTVDINAPRDIKYSLDEASGLKYMEHDYNSLGKSRIEEKETKDSIQELSIKSKNILEENGDSTKNNKDTKKILVGAESSSSDSIEELPSLKFSPPNIRKKTFLVEWDKDITNEMMAPQVLREVSFVSESSSTSSSSEVDSEEDNGRTTKQMSLSSGYQRIIPYTIQELSTEEYSDEHDGITNLPPNSDQRNNTKIQHCVRVSSSSESEIIHSPPDPMQVLNPNKQLSMKKNLKRSKSLDSLSSLGSDKSNTIHVDPIVDLVSSSSLSRIEKGTKSYDSNIKYPVFYSLNRNYKPVYEVESLRYKNESLKRSISTESL